MYTPILYSLILFFSFFSSEPTLKERVSFKKNPDQFAKYSSPQLIEVSSAFNSAPELSPFFNFLKAKYHLNTAIETGTFKGSTTTLFARLFDTVHTIEISESTFQEAKETLKPYENIQCHLGSSEKVLSNILPSVKGKPVLFYLDAHWQEHWPLLEELEEISKTHRDNCIIVVDDIKVPGKNSIPYDKYGEHECSHEYMKTQLDKVFSEYTYHYVIPKSASSRAKFVAIPKKWQK
jgi:predicted O-methyltransferase YrrM